MTDEEFNAYASLVIVLFIIVIMSVWISRTVRKKKAANAAMAHAKEGYEGPNYGWFSSDYLYGAAGTVPPCGSGERPPCALTMM